MLYRLLQYSDGAEFEHRVISMVDIGATEKFRALGMHRGLPDPLAGGVPVAWGLGRTPAHGATFQLDQRRRKVRRIVQRTCGPQWYRRSPRGISG